MSRSNGIIVYVLQTAVLFVLVLRKLPKEIVQRHTRAARIALDAGAAGITIHPASTNTFLRLVGEASLDDYAVALGQVRFNNPSPTPSNIQRTVSPPWIFARSKTCVGRPTSSMT